MTAPQAARDGLERVLASLLEQHKQIMGIKDSVEYLNAYSKWDSLAGNFVLNHGAALLDEVERLRKAIRVQASAVETLRSTDRILAAHDRAAAERLNASCKPELVASEKAANAMLTDALESAEKRAEAAEKVAREAVGLLRRIRANGFNGPIYRATMAPGVSEIETFLAHHVACAGDSNGSG